MGTTIDHDARKREILARSILLFSEQGYDGVTYQKIADSCGIGRTTLYKYFHNKREIFSYTVRQITGLLDAQYTAILADKQEPSALRLERIMLATLTIMFREQVLFTVILDYVLASQRGGRNMAGTIRRYTQGLVRLLRHLVWEGMRRGEFTRQPVDVVTQNLYALLECATLRLTISENADFAQLETMIRQSIRTLKAPCNHA